MTEPTRAVRAVAKVIHGATNPDRTWGHESDGIRAAILVDAQAVVDNLPRLVGKHPELLGER